jgi:hypothetical protein
MLPPLGLFVLLCLLATAQDEKPKEEEKKKPEPPKIVKPTQKEIDAAIQQGAEYIKQQQNSDGSWPMGPGDIPRHRFRNQMGPQTLGHTALMLLTLLHADVKVEDSVVERAFNFLFEKREEFAHTYNCALTLMALDMYVEKKAKAGAKGRRHKRPVSKEKVFRKQSKVFRLFATELMMKLYAGQLEDGSWTYWASKGKIPGLGTGVREEEDEDKKEDENFKRPKPPDIGGDLSNTQYALLGLRAAAEMGIQFSDSVWANAAKLILSRQEAKKEPVVPGFFVPIAAAPWGKRLGSRGRGKTEVGSKRRDFVPRGWGYVQSTTRTHAYGAMTVIGVASLSICKHYGHRAAGFTKKIREQIDAAIEDGCAWLVENYDILDNIKWKDPTARYRRAEGKIDGYYMYGWERAGILTGLIEFGGRDWYAEGARYLVDEQAEDGSWSAQMFYEPKATISTAFAVLFLKRATKPLTIRTGSQR